LRAPRVGARLSGDLVAHRVQTQPAFVKNLCRHRTFFTQQSEQEMFGTDVTVLEAVAFFVGVSQYVLGFRGERQLNRG
jgi:hypothetical protein